MMQQHFFGIGVKIMFQLKLDHLPAPPPLDCAAERADQIFCLFLDFDVAVAQDAKRPVAFDAKAGEQVLGETANQALDADIDRLFARHPDKPRQGRRDQDHLDHLRVVGFSRQIEQQPDALVRYERERVRRIKRLRRDDRHDLFKKIRLERGIGGRIDPRIVRNRNPGIIQQAAQFGPAFALFRIDFAHRFPDRGQLLRRTAAVDR